LRADGLRHAQSRPCQKLRQFDIIVRYLRYLGYNVTYVQNITDVGHLTDDADQARTKSQRQRRRSQQTRWNWRSFIHAAISRYGQAQLRQTRYKPAGKRPYRRANRISKDTFAKGYAYEANGSVYSMFQIRRIRETIGQERRGYDCGARVEVSQEKKNPADSLSGKGGGQSYYAVAKPVGQGFPAGISNARL